jgi:amino acid transporter
MYNFFMATYLTGVYASAMTAQTSVSRIFYAMGREGVLPRKVFPSASQIPHTVAGHFVRCHHLAAGPVP